MLGALAAKLAPLLRGRVAVVTGAGVSAESGIPTFRGAGGYWRKHDARKLATREAFQRDPALVWEWYEERRAAVRSAAPNAAHEAIARLADMSRDHLVITQNVDDLHERGGTRAERLVHVHGEIFRTTCLGCDFATSEAVPSVPPPKCPRCRALLRPGVVWFGEMLERAQIERVENFFARGSCDLVMTIGTTAVFDYVKDWSTRGGTLVEINPDTTPLSVHAEHVVRAPAGEVLPLLMGLAPSG
jgi:NAD-dependent deacetylase